jgi:hypothetical protein
VQGLARVGSQLTSTSFGSFHVALCLYRMSPWSHNNKHACFRKKKDCTIYTQCYGKRLNMETMLATSNTCSLPSVLQLASAARARRQLRKTPVAAAN